MAELKYRGAETIDYKQADFSELKYIKILYLDSSGQTREIVTEINFMSDNFLSLYAVKEKGNTAEEKEEKDEIKILKNDKDLAESGRLDFEEYLKKIAEIKAAKDKIGITGNFSEYYKKLAELKQENIELKKSEEYEKSKEELEEEKRKEEENLKKQKELEEEEKKKYSANCPQEVVLKFVIDDLLYVAKTELKGIGIKASKVYFNVKAPAVLKLKQRRRFYRIVLRRLCMLVATNITGSENSFIAKSINLSAGGILLNGLEPVVDGSRNVIYPNEYKAYNIVIVLEPDKVIKLEARYVRQEAGKKSKRYAFEFINVSPEKIDFLSKYVIRKQIEKLGIEFDVKFNAKTNQIIKKRKR